MTMNNDEILKALEDAAETSDIGQSEPISIIKFLIILIGERKLAINAELIREIVLDLPIFFMPFVPSYVRGLANRHGEPHTVLDLNILFDRKLLNSATFLILSDQTNPAAFLISDVLEIMRVPENEIHEITVKEDGFRFFQGAITGEDSKEILILDTSEVFKRLELDIG